MEVRGLCERAPQRTLGISVSPVRDSAAGELPNDVGGVNGDWLYLSVAHTASDT